MFVEWNEKHPELVARSDELEAEIARQQWNRLDHIVVELPADASPEEEVYAEMEELAIRRTNELRGQNPGISPEAFRDVIAADKPLHDLWEAQEKYLPSLTIQKLSREIRKLEAAEARGEQ